MIALAIVKNKRILAAGFLAVIFCLFYSGKVSAGTWQLPDPSDDNSGGQIALVASNRNAARTNLLEAPVSIVRLFVPAGGPNGHIIIEGGGYCGNTPTQKDWLFARDGWNNGTYFQTFSLNSNESGRTAVTNAVGDSSVGCGDFYMPINIGSYPVSTVMGHTNYRVVEFEAWNNLGGSGNLNGFHLRTNIPGAMFSYYSQSGQQFAILERDGVTNSPRELHDITLRFAPSCSVGAGGWDWRNIVLYDGDEFTAYQGDYFAILREYNSSGAPTGRDMRIDSMGGEGATIYVGQVNGYPFVGGNKYTFTVYGVSESNGLQFQLPYDSFNFNQSCNRLPVGNIDSASCDSVQGWAFDPDTPSQSITIHFYVNAALGQPGAIGFNDGPTDQPRPDVNSAYGISGNHGFYWPIPSQFKDGLLHNVYVYALDSSSGFSYLGVRTFGPCTMPPAVACGNVQTTPTTPEPGEPFTVTVNFTTNSGSGPDVPYTVYLEVPGYYPNTLIGAGTVARSGGSVNSTNSPPLAAVVINNPGAYSGTFTVAVTGGNPNPLSCPFGAGQPRPPIIVASRPYVRLYGSDAMTGSGFDSAGCSTSSSRFIGFNKGRSGNGAGAGTNLGTFATGRNVDFVSAALRTGNPRPLKGLAFANTGPRDPNATPDDNYGGELGSGYFNCVPDYYALGIANGAIPKPNGYNVNTDVNSVASGTKYDIYVDGDAFITNEITYATAGGFGVDPSLIPSFRLVARGNIYIAPGVNQIDGVLIAQPLSDGTKGRVYTCADNGWSGNSPAFVPTEAQQIASCNERLTIVGAVVAKQIKFMRTYGTLRNAVSNEIPFLFAPNPNRASENIIFSPEVWLRNPGSGSSSGQTPYNSISGQPPIL